MKKFRRRNYQRLQVKYKSRRVKKKSKIMILICLILKLLLIILIVFICFHFYEFILETKDIEKIYLKERVKAFRNYNESNLLTFSDKINWLAIHDMNKLKARCADKILLHKYAKRILGKDICNKIIKIYNDVEEINMNELPDKFVLKANHGSGFNIIVDNKTNYNISQSKINLKKWFQKDYGKKHTEFQYTFVERKIFAEEYIGNTLKNYKFLCYDGNPKYVYVSINENHHKYRNFYDMNWNLLDYDCLSVRHPTYNYEKPKLFDLMKEYASKLSYYFKFVRVDLYELENEVRLGELTFTPMNSYFFCRNKLHEIELGKDIVTKKTLYDYFIHLLDYLGLVDYIFL